MNHIDIQIYLIYMEKDVAEIWRMEAKDPTTTDPTKNQLVVESHLTDKCSFKSYCSQFNFITWLYQIIQQILQLDWLHEELLSSYTDALNCLEALQSKTMRDSKQVGTGKEPKQGKERHQTIPLDLWIILIVIDQECDGSGGQGLRAGCDIEHCIRCDINLTLSFY